LSQLSTSADDHIPIIVCSFDSLLDFFLYTVHFPGFQKLPVRESVQPFLATTYAYKFHHITIPRSNILITDWPIHSKTVTPRTFEIVLTPSLSLSCPNQ